MRLRHPATQSTGRQAKLLCKYLYSQLPTLPLYDKKDNMLPTHQHQMVTSLALAMTYAISGRRLQCACVVPSGITEASHHLETALSQSKAEKMQLTAQSPLT